MNCQISQKVRKTETRSSRAAFCPNRRTSSTLPPTSYSSGRTKSSTRYQPHPVPELGAGGKPSTRFLRQRGVNQGGAFRPDA
eukprot:1338138-Pyramimonas_sp.AAC.1